MSFLGPVTRSEGRLVRPHDLKLHDADPGRGGVKAKVTRITRVGFEVRVDLEVGTDPATVSLTRTEFNQLRLHEGDNAWVRAVAGAPTVALQAV